MSQHVGKVAWRGVAALRISDGGIGAMIQQLPHQIGDALTSGDVQRRIARLGAPVRVVMTM
jgi:hypothetical protein